VQGELVTRHCTGTPRPIHASCTRHGHPHVRHGCRAATTRPERLAAFVHKKHNPTGKITATPLPPTSTSQSTQHHCSTTYHAATAHRKNHAHQTPRTLPRSLQQLSNNLRGGVMWETFLTSYLQIIKLQFVCIFCIMIINNCIEG
jgi:hypothetical protein